MQQTNTEDQNIKASTMTQQFAAYWSKCTLEDLSQDVIVMVRHRLLDTLAAGIAGVDAQETDLVRKGILAVHGLHSTAPQRATLWGCATTLPAPQAALVNGTAAHARELDDFDGCGHTGAVVVPAVSAVAQACGADGATVITAIAAGYDLAGRMLNAAGGYRPHNGLGWHSTATCGTFGAALASARVLGLNAEQTAHALGIAGSYMGGVWAFMQDGAMTKRMHPGKAAETGVTAAYLAQAGMTGPQFILESQWGGFFSTYCGPHAKPDLLLHDLGHSNAIALTGIKPYACCRGSHPGIDAILQLRQTHGLQIQEISHIDVHCAPHVAKLVGSSRVSNVLEAQMSMPYALAVTALTGRADFPQFANLQVEHPEVARLMKSTVLHPDLPADSICGPLVKVYCQDGRTLQAQVDFAKGHPRNPVTDGELRAKAASLIVPQMGEGRFIALEAAIDQLASAVSFASISELLQPVA